MGTLNPSNDVLCRRGFHDWELGEMAMTFQLAFPEKSHIYRRCRHCRVLDYLSDDKTCWQRGARGTYGPPSEVRYGKKYDGIGNDEKGGD